jgi:hypothetical protein
MIRISQTGTMLWRFCAEAFGGGSQRPPRPHTPASPGRGSELAYPRRPREILAVYPEAGSVAGPAPEISVRFLLYGAMLKDGAMDEGAFSLAIDGEDVTAKTSILSSMNHPQSHGTLLYRPTSRLPPGRHEASVFFPGGSGGRCRYLWHFEVRLGPRGQNDRSREPSQVPPAPPKVAHANPER